MKASTHAKWMERQKRAKFGTKFMLGGVFYNVFYKMFPSFYGSEKLMMQQQQLNECYTFTCKRCRGKCRIYDYDPGPRMIQPISGVLYSEGGSRTKMYLLSVGKEIDTTMRNFSIV